MSENVIFASDIFFAKQVLSLVVENDMDFFGAWSTNIGSYEKNINEIISTIMDFV
jgi:hypothetical protein